VRVSGGETPPFRPPIPPDDRTNDAQLLQLMRDCWDEYQSLRPDFSTIRKSFLLINKGKYAQFTMYISGPRVTERQKRTLAASTLGKKWSILLLEKNDGAHRRAEGQTPNRCYSLSTLNAASVCILHV